jgi:AbrB family looped-hinge helix DNA binding protein
MTLENPEPKDLVMRTQLTIDSAGRIVPPPKPLRNELDIGPGDLLELEHVGERITLRPVRGGMPLAKGKGVWVFRSGQALQPSVTGRHEGAAEDFQTYQNGGQQDRDPASQGRVTRKCGVMIHRVLAAP